MIGGEDGFSGAAVLGDALDASQVLLEYKYDASTSKYVSTKNKWGNFPELRWSADRTVTTHGSGTLFCRTMQLQREAGCSTALMRPNAVDRPRTTNRLWASNSHGPW